MSILHRADGAAPASQETLEAIIAHKGFELHTLDLVAVVRQIGKPRAIAAVNPDEGVMDALVAVYPDNYAFPAAVLMDIMIGREIDILGLLSALWDKRPKGKWEDDKDWVKLSEVVEIARLQDEMLKDGR